MLSMLANYRTNSPCDLKWSQEQRGEWPCWIASHMAEFLVTRSQIARNQCFDVQTIISVARKSAKCHFTLPHPTLTGNVIKLDPLALDHKERIIDIHFRNLYIKISNHVIYKHHKEWCKVNVSGIKQGCRTVHNGITRFSAPEEEFWVFFLSAKYQLLTPRFVWRCWH